MENDKQLQQILSQIQGLYSEEEKDFIRTQLKGNINVMVLLRNFFLQGEYERMDDFRKPQWLMILKRIYFPEIDFSRPLGQVRDLWSYMNPYNRQPDEASLEIDARLILGEYLTQRFKVLVNGQEDDRDIKLKNLTPDEVNDPKTNLINLMARHLIISGVEGSTSQLLMIANSTKETEEEIKERRKRDSSK